MLIREAVPQDIKGVHDVCDAGECDRWPEHIVYVQQDRLVVVAQTEDKLVGVAKTHFHQEPDEGAPAGHYLGGVIVSRSYRRHGVASALTRSRLEWIWSQSRTAYYFANEHNTASIRMHEAFGFHPIGRFPSIHGVTADGGRSELVLFEASR
jgi:aminoglycoside 6'-N-acetyltransferase I